MDKLFLYFISSLLFTEIFTVDTSADQNSLQFLKSFNFFFCCSPSESTSRSTSGRVTRRAATAVSGFEQRRSNSTTASGSVRWQRVTSPLRTRSQVHLYDLWLEVSTDSDIYIYNGCILYHVSNITYRVHSVSYNVDHVLYTYNTCHVTYVLTTIS